MTRTTSPLAKNGIKDSTSALHQRRRLSKQYGQGMTEYIIIVALIAVAAIGSYRFFGQTVRSQTAGISAEVAGQSATASITAAKTAATGAQTEATKTKGLDTYNSK